MSDVQIWGWVLAAVIVTAALVSAALWSVTRR
jgi:hypothetical protein